MGVFVNSHVQCRRVFPDDQTDHKDWSGQNPLAEKLKPCTGKLCSPNEGGVYL